MVQSALIRQLLFLLCLGITHKSTFAQLKYEIKTQWDGTPLVQENYATVELTKNGELLNIAVSAPFYNSGIPPGEVITGGCPQRPYDSLYSYEVLHLQLFSNLASESKCILLARLWKPFCWMTTMSIWRLRSLPGEDISTCLWDKMSHWRISTWMRGSKYYPFSQMELRVNSLFICGGVSGFFCDR